MDTHGSHGVVWAPKQRTHTHTDTGRSSSLFMLTVSIFMSELLRASHDVYVYLRQICSLANRRDRLADKGSTLAVTAHLWLSTCDPARYGAC